jgi:hypothetical protein
MTDNKPWLLVRDPGYFRGVLGSMVAFHANARHESSITVRFGLTGDGIRPNYQIEAPARVAPKRGDNHRDDMHAAATGYTDADLSSERFTLVEVQALLKSCLRAQGGRNMTGQIAADEDRDGAAAWATPEGRFRSS